MKRARAYIALLSGVLLVGCARNSGTTVRDAQATVNDTVELTTLSHGSLLEAGRTYSAHVKRELNEGRTTWCVQNSPIPRHYAVGFDWLNLSNLDNPRDGVWTFVVTDIERWHDPSRGGPMGRFTASYKCDVLRIEDARK